VPLGGVSKRIRSDWSAAMVSAAPAAWFLALLRSGPNWLRPNNEEREEEAVTGALGLRWQGPRRSRAREGKAEAGLGPSRKGGLKIA
jgi:hypothetical protein